MATVQEARESWDIDLDKRDSSGEEVNHNSYENEEDKIWLYFCFLKRMNIQKKYSDNKVLKYISLQFNSNIYAVSSNSPP